MIDRIDLVRSKLIHKGFESGAKKVCDVDVQSRLHKFKGGLTALTDFRTTPALIPGKNSCDDSQLPQQCVM